MKMAVKINLLRKRDLGQMRTAHSGKDFFNKLGEKMSYTQKIALRIVKLCREQQISISKLAVKSQIPLDMIDWIWKTEDTYDPPLEVIWKICCGLGITLHEFFDADDVR